MNKQEFIDELRAKLSKLPNIDIEERLRFYEEMINDRVEDGLSEEEAIKDIGSIDMIYDQIANDAPKTHLTLDKTRQKSKLCKNRKIIILSSTAIIWAPVLLSLVVSAFAVAISLFATLWSLVASAWSVFAALIAAVPLGALIGILNVFSGNFLRGIMILSAGMVSAGLAIFAFFGSLYATKGAAALTNSAFHAIRNFSIRR